MQIKDLIKKSCSTLKKAGVPSAYLDVQILLAHVLDKNKTWLIANSDYRLNLRQLEKINVLIEKRSKRIPVAYLTKIKEFYDTQFYVNRYVLIPRNESEALAEWAIELAPKKSKLLEVGTGSGAVAIAIKKARTDLNVSASDISKKAIEIAHKNANFLLSNHKVNFVISDLFEKITNKFDLIIANLPYVPSIVKDRISPEAKYEPALAMFGGEGDGLDIYQRFFAQAVEHLRRNGYLLIECDYYQKQKIINYAQRAKLKLIKESHLHLAFKN